jgi:hypothetical protein
MESLGLIELGNEAATLVDHGGSALSRFWVHTWQLTDDGMIANGAVTQSQVVDARRALEDPTFIYRGALMQAAWGRRS